LVPIPLPGQAARARVERLKVIRAARMLALLSPGPVSLDFHAA